MRPINVRWCVTNLMMDKTEVRKFIKYLQKKDATSKNIQEDIEMTLAEDFFYYATLKKCTADSTEYDLRLGRPTTSTTDEQVDII